MLMVLSIVLEIRSTAVQVPLLVATIRVMSKAFNNQLLKVVFHL